MNFSRDRWREVLEENWMFLLFLVLLVSMVLLTPEFFDFDSPFYFMTSNAG